MFSPLLYLRLSLQQLQLLTKYQNENRDGHVELNIVDFTFLLIFVSLCMLCFCYSVCICSRCNRKRCLTNRLSKKIMVKVVIFNICLDSKLTSLFLPVFSLHLSLCLSLISSKGVRSRLSAGCHVAPI